MLDVQIRGNSRDEVNRFILSFLRWTEEARMAPIIRQVDEDLSQLPSTITASFTVDF